MPKRKSPSAGDPAAAQTPPADPSAGTSAVDPVSQPAEAPTSAVSHDPVQAPPKGERDAYTIDNRLGYRKEDTGDDRRRQIRFADRPDGKKPDDEMLAPVREKKPDVRWRDRAWQARKVPEGFNALDDADQELAEIGRKRTGGSPQR
jgi:hypothetical protein